MYDVRGVIRIAVSFGIRLVLFVLYVSAIVVVFGYTHGIIMHIRYGTSAFYESFALFHRLPNITDLYIKLQGTIISDLPFIQWGDFILFGKGNPINQIMQAIVDIAKTVFAGTVALLWTRIISRIPILIKYRTAYSAIRVIGCSASICISIIAVEFFQKNVPSLLFCLFIATMIILPPIVSAFVLKSVIG